MSPVSRTAVGAAGVLGRVCGVTRFDSVEKSLVPVPLMAATWKWYSVPSVRPEMVQVVAVEVVAAGQTALSFWSLRS